MATEMEVTSRNNLRSEALKEVGIPGIRMTQISVVKQVVKRVGQVPRASPGPVSVTCDGVGLVSWSACPCLDCSNRGQQAIFVLPA
eukprot:scaffold340788_cov59-Attheya_sp.AAC.1